MVLRRAVRRDRRAASTCRSPSWRPAPARWPCSTTCCRRCASPATRWSTPGGRSRRTRSRSPSPAPRRCRCRSTRRAPRPRRDGRRDHRAHQGGRRLHPQQPDRPGRHGAELAAFLERVPAHVLVVVDEAYREFVTRRRRPPTGSRLPARGPTWSCCGPSPRPTGWPACGSATPSRRAGGHGDPQGAHCRSGSRRCRPGGCRRLAGGRGRAARAGRRRSCAERERVVAGLREQGWDVPDAQGNFVWLPLGDDAVAFAAACEEAGVVRAAVRRRRACGSPSARPAANDVFLEVARSPRTAGRR